MRKLLSNLNPYKWLVAIALALLVAQAFLDLYLPELNKTIINEGIYNTETGLSDVPTIWRYGGWMLAVALGSMACAGIAGYFSSKAAMGLGKEIRHKVFAKVLTFSSLETNKFGASSLITRIQNDVQQVQMSVMMVLRMMITAPIMMVGGVIMALRQDTTLSWSIAVLVPILGLVIGLLASKLMPSMKLLQKKLDRVTQVAREKLAGVRVIRAFVRTKHERDRFDTANAEHADTNLKINKMVSYMMPVMTVILNFAVVAVLWVGFIRIDAGDLSMGAMTAFITYMMQILMAVMMSTMMFIMLPRAIASAERINAVLDTNVAITDGDGGAPDTALIPGQVQFKDVSFRYEGAADDVLHAIRFTALPGQTTAVIGSTGSGKSTLVALLPRFYDVTEGELLIEGEDVRTLPLHKLREKLGFVPQKAFLFTGTIASNLRYGKEDATDDELWAALETAQAADFVRGLPEGLDAPIDQGGANVSGGQRQRLAIARALVAKPPVFVFDDSFSALDFKTEANLRAALKRDLGGSTVLVVAQRISTIMTAEQILVLDEGRLVGVGTHQQLMKDCEVYREIALSQLSDEEVSA